MASNKDDPGSFMSLCYLSKSNSSFAQEQLNSLVLSAGEFNASEKITGILYYKDEYFFQYLEGPAGPLTALMERIGKDERHQVICVIEFPEEVNPRFADWSLLHISQEYLASKSLIEPLVKICLREGRQQPLSDTTKTNLRVLLDCLANDPFRENEPGVRIIAIGASAGGIGPIRTLLSDLPADINAAFLIVLHLSPNHETVLDEILERDTGLPVHLAKDGDVVEPGVVYLIPPSKNLEVVNGKIKISSQLRIGERKSAGRGQAANIPLPIDILFENLANQYGKKVIGVLLSGSGSDGTRGAKRLQEVGAIVIAQNPETAEFDRLPRSAINANAVDRILEPDEISGAILNLLKLNSNLNSQPLSRDEYNHVESVLYVMMNLGINFTGYKRRTIINRLRRRRALLEVESLDDYLALVKNSKQERELLKDDLLICVTDFFRDRPAWDVLRVHVENELLPLVNRLEKKTLRVWVPGCATGEEAYSIAILLEELFEENNLPANYKIFASDLSEKSLEVATHGIYKHTLLEMLPEHVLRKYFTKEKDTYQINASVREKAIVARHNLAEDPPFTNMHLVSCRNLLIYMDQQLKFKVLKSLHFSLNKDGLLFIGPSESTSDLASEFDVIDQQWNIYQNKTEFKLPLQLEEPVSSNWKSKTRMKSSSDSNRESKKMIYKNGLEGICSIQSKTALILDNKKNVELVVADPNSLLQVGSGEPSSSIEMLLVKSLVQSVVVHLQQLDKLGNDIITSRTISCIDNQGQDVTVDLEIIKLGSDSQAPNWLLTFVPSSMSSDSSDLYLTSDPLNPQSDSKLKDLQNTLYETVQELEVSNKEQQLAVEQLTTANEELQSTNEELQSVNEELYTVNFEYQTKIHELSDMTNDMDNLMKSTDMGVIFLDANVCIRHFTDRAAAITMLTTSDIGRPVQVIAQQLNYKNLSEEVARVLSLGNPIEKDIAYNDCPSRLHIGIYPYRVDSEFSQGALITMMDLADLQSFYVDTPKSEGKHKSSKDDNRIIRLESESES